MRSAENMAAVAQTVLEHPSTSTRHRSQELNIPCISLRRILHKYLGMKAYKVQIVQELKSHNHPMHRPIADSVERTFIEYLFLHLLIQI